MMHSTETGSSAQTNPVRAGSNSTHRSSKSNGKRVATKSRRHHSGASKSIRKRHQKKHGKSSRAPAFQPKTCMKIINGMKITISTDLSVIDRSTDITGGIAFAFSHKRNFYFFDLNATATLSDSVVLYGIGASSKSYPLYTLKAVYDMSRKGFSSSLQPESAKLLSKLFAIRKAPAPAAPASGSPTGGFWNTVLPAAPASSSSVEAVGPSGAGPNEPIDLFSDSSDEDDASARETGASGEIIAPVAPVVPSAVSGMNVEVSTEVEEEDPARQCSICLDNSVESNGNPKLFTKCGHVLCSSCYVDYVHKNASSLGDFTCPTCRRFADLESVVTIHASVKKCVGCNVPYDSESCDGIRVLVCGHVSCRPCCQKDSATASPVVPGQFGADKELVTMCPLCYTGRFQRFDKLCRVDQRLVDTILDPQTSSSGKGKEAAA